MNSIIRETTEQINDFLNTKAELENPSSVMEMLNDASSLLGTCSGNIATCEKIYLEKLGLLAAEYAGRPATVAKNIIMGKLSEELYYKTLCESQDKQLHYKIESLRTMISFLKNEMSAIRS